MQCLYVCWYVGKHVCVYLCMYICLFGYLFVCICNVLLFLLMVLRVTDVCRSMYVCSVCMYVGMLVSMLVCMQVCVFVCLFFVCLFVCLLFKVCMRWYVLHVKVKSICNSIFVDYVANVCMQMDCLEYFCRGFQGYVGLGGMQGYPLGGLR